MFESDAHKYLKDILQGDPLLWPHNLTLGRLIARSLRRKDNTLINLETSSRDSFWLGLLIPLALSSSTVVLVISARQRNHLLQIEIPRLIEHGMSLSIHQGNDCPPKQEKIWLLDYYGLIHAYQNNCLGSRQLIFAETEFLEQQLREALSITIDFNDWKESSLIKSPQSSFLMSFYGNVSRKLFLNSSKNESLIRIETGEMQRFQDLLNQINFVPSSWSNVLHIETQSWVSWARMDYEKLRWDWFWQPLDSFYVLRNLFLDHSFLMLSKSYLKDVLLSCLRSIDCSVDVQAKLGGTISQEPISLFLPSRQPLPNNQFYGHHLLHQCRRLILGRSGLTIILLDDSHFRCRLTSELAADFGRRVVHETIPSKHNAVICCRCSWWLTFYEQLPIPDQLIFALIPFPSMESPLISAKVESFKKQGRDWFREFLLPETMSLISFTVSLIRNKPVRVAILDGRLKLRDWGSEILQILEPWTPLTRLLPN